MLTGVMAPGSEESVNFRYDIDNRYHQGVTIVMKPGLYACFKSEGAWIEDLYSQHIALGVKDKDAVRGTGKRMRKVKSDYEKPFLESLTKKSDFRSKQIESPSGSIKLPGDTDEHKKVPIIACHNPQLRIPYVIGINHIDFIILTQEAWDSLSEQIRCSSNHPKAKY